MMAKISYEEKFWQILEDMFVGAEIEEKSGYINLLKVKRKYFKNYLKPNLAFNDRDIFRLIGGN